MRQSGCSTWRRSRCLIAFVTLALPLTNALGVMSAIAHPYPSPRDTNVSLPLRSSYRSAERELLKGVEVIESMKMASSCTTIATQQLLNSCSALDDSQMKNGAAAKDLDKVKSQYAARLAVCELQQAATPPKLQRCSTLGNSEFAGTVANNHLASCLRELQSNMVFWASYTNNLQNVGYMCQVARAEIEKDELIEQRRASLETTLLVTRVLSEFQQSVATQNAELFLYTQKVRDLHRQNVEELVAARKDGSAMLHELRQEFAAQLQKVADKAQAVVETVTTNAAETNEEVLRYVGNVQQSLSKIWQKMAEGNAELAARQIQDANNGHELAVTAQTKLESIIVDEIDKLSDGLSALSRDLLSVGGQAASLRQGHSLLAESLDQSMAKSSHVAQILNQLNMPILEMFAKAASFAGFVFTDECLMLMGFISPMIMVFLFATVFQIRYMFWLCRLGLFLLSSYVISRLYNARDSSPILQRIFQSAWQAITMSLALACACGIILVSFETTQAIRRRTHDKPSLARYIDEDEEFSPFKQARKKSVENAMRSRFERASTSPPY